MSESTYSPQVSMLHATTLKCLLKIETIKTSKLFLQGHAVFQPKSVDRICDRLVFVSSRLVASLTKMLRKHPVDGFDSEAEIATSRQGCGQDAESNAEIS